MPILKAEPDLKTFPGGTWERGNEVIRLINVYPNKRANRYTTPLNFGNYDPIVANASTALDAANTTAMSITCTDGTAYSVGINQGQNPASGSTTLNPLRQMANGTARLRYDLYRNSPRTSIWGDIGTANVRSGTDDGNGTSFALYGRIPANQNAAVGNYNDTVLVTVSF